MYAVGGGEVCGPQGGSVPPYTDTIGSLIGNWSLTDGRRSYLHGQHPLGAVGADDADLVLGGQAETSKGRGDGSGDLREPAGVRVVWV